MRNAVSIVGWWIAVVGGWLPAVAARGEFAPREASVLISDAPVRSGPSEDYYITQRLPRNARVEVYREDAGGWLAIRPPEGSFSCVDRRNLVPASDAAADVMQATREGVPVLVGSSVSGDRDVIWVKLRRGERVVVLGRDAGNEARWQRIEPPAGEFRWIAAKHVKFVMPIGELPASGGALSVVNQGVPTASSTPSTSRATAAKPGPVESGEDRTAPMKAWPTDGSVPAELQRLEFELTATLANPSAEWCLDDLERQANALLDKAPTVEERDRLRQYLTKMARLQALQRQRTTAFAAQPTAIPAAPIAGIADNAAVAIDPRFDGMGRLREVWTLDPRAPKFALYDAQGRIVTYVSPSPGVNLRPLVGHEVGIQGTRGYLGEAAQPHLTAQRVTPLGTVRR